MFFPNINLKRNINWITLLASCIIFGLLSIIFGQDVDFDQKNYHIYNIYAWMNQRYDRDIMVAGMQSYINPTLNLVNYFMIMNLPPKVAGFFLGAVPGLNFFLLFNIGVRCLSNLPSRTRVLISLFAALTGVISPIFIVKLGSTQGDNTTSIFVLLGVLLSIQALNKIHKDKHHKIFSSQFLLLFSGISFGFASGLKLTNLTYAIAAIISFTMIFAIWRVPIKMLIRSFISIGMGISVGAIAGAGPWMWLMQSKYGSPLFPFYNSFFKSPYWSFVDIGSNKQPGNLLEILWYPFNWLQYSKHSTYQRPFQDWRWAIISLLLVISLTHVLSATIKPKKVISSPEINNRNTTSWANSASRIYILTFTITGYFIWGLQFSNQRFLLPLDLLSGIIIFLLIDLIFQRFSPKLILSSFLCVLIMLTMRLPSAGRLEWENSWFGVDPPQLSNPNNSLIIYVSEKPPIGYLVPFFQHGISFVKIRGWWQSAIRGTLLEQETVALIEGHIGDIYSLSSDDLSEEELSILKDEYGLEPDSSLCSMFTTRVQRSKVFHLCPLVETVAGETLSFAQNS